MSIYFYNSRQNYFELSNFLEGYPIVINGETFPTTENYFQAQKFITNSDMYFAMKQLKRPLDAYKNARKYAKFLRPDWYEVNVSIMLTALRAKFTQHDKLKKILLDTGDAQLIENSPYDSFWGIGTNGQGKNMLGKLLMQLRTELRNK